MVASIQPHTPHPDGKSPLSAEPEKGPDGQNRVLRVLMARLGSSMTFGENMIFMLNRAGELRIVVPSCVNDADAVSGRTPEDLVMQLLVLKILYVLFTTKGTSEYFYFNDLTVLVDVFLREITNLDEEHESVSMACTVLMCTTR